MPDIGLVSKDHLYKTIYYESSGHVTDDVTWPQKVEVMTPKYLRLRIGNHER